MRERAIGEWPSDDFPPQRNKERCSKPVVAYTGYSAIREREREIESMILHRAWWILLIYFRSITTLLALQNPMRYQLQRVVTSTIVRFKSVLSSSSSSFQRSQKTTPFDATYHKDSSIHKRVLYYFRSSATNESYKRHWISSTTTSLRMSTEENGMIRLTPTTTGSTTRPQPLPQSTDNEADDVTDSAMTQQWEKLYQGSSSNSIHKIDYLR